jgi:outer membrane immunogenic protein
MSHRTLAALCGAVVVTSAASAADLPSRAPPPVYAPPAPIFTWTGLYGGIQAGYVWANDKGSIQNPGDPPALVPAPVYIPFTTAMQGVIGGFHAGYNIQVNQWLVGVEGSVDGTSASRSQFIGVPPLFGGSTKAYTNVQGSIRARLGVAWDRWLAYVTGGVAFAGVTNTYDTVAFGGSVDSISKTQTGWTVGGGLAYALTNNWSVGVEYRYSDFGHYADHSGTAFFPASTLNHHLTQSQVQGRLTYKFDTAPPPAPAVSKY